jgi:hypothetical protein
LLGLARHGTARSGWAGKGEVRHGFIKQTKRKEMKQAEVKIKGLRPILFHAFKIEAITNLEQKKSGSAGNNPEEWKSSVLERGGQLYVPASYWSGCLKEASRYTKAGRGSIQKSFISSSLVLTEISLIDRWLPEGWEKMAFNEMPSDSSQDVYLDIRAVMNPNSKGKNIRYRVACCPGWKTDFAFSFDDSIVSPSQIKKILDDAGKMVGIGDARVLGYGRFEIESVKITEMKE